MNVLDIIKMAQDTRTERRVHPSHVPEVELIRLLVATAMAEIEDLIKSGKVGVVNSINQKCYFIKK